MDIDIDEVVRGMSHKEKTGTLLYPLLYVVVPLDIASGLNNSLEPNWSQ